jgi:glycosyltransferase involved in cell wall biosynthesis
MKIGYLTSARIPSRAANAVQSTKMCAAFAALGHDVTMFCRAGDVDVDVFGDFGVDRAFAHRPIAPSRLRGTRTLAFEWAVRDAARAVAPDLYFARDVFALALVATTQRPLLLELHRTMEGHRAEQLALSWLLTQPNFRGVVVVSAAMGRWFAERFPGAPIVVEPGAATNVDAVVGVSRGRPGALQVGYVGHLYAGRGVELIADVARRVADRAHDVGIDVDFHVVGGDERDIARCRSTLHAPHLTFHGFVPHGELPTLTKSFDVVLAPYQRQVFVQGGAETSAVMSPLKVFEYMATGAAIVASDLPVLHEVLAPAWSVLLPPDDAGAWADAVVDLARDPARRRALGAAAHARFLARHTWTARASRVLATLTNGGAA